MGMQDKNMGGSCGCGSSHDKSQKQADGKEMNKQSGPANERDVKKSADQGTQGTL